MPNNSKNNESTQETGQAVSDGHDESVSEFDRGVNDQRSIVINEPVYVVPELVVTGKIHQSAKANAECEQNLSCRINPNLNALYMCMDVIHMLYASLYLSIPQFAPVRDDVEFNTFLCAFKKQSFDEEDEEDHVWKCGREVHDLNIISIIIVHRTFTSK